MPKECWKMREKRNEATVARYAAVRKELKDKKDYAGLAKLPRDASPVRLKNRCQLCGRAHGYMGRFSICRICFRELAHQGLIPGVTKSSW